MTKIERPCENCGVTVARTPSAMQARRIYCSPACHHASRNKTPDERSSRKLLILPDHPLAGTTGFVAESRAVLYAKIGPGWHKCHWCESRVRWRRRTQKHKGSLVVDHVDNNWRNNDPSNLVPSCQPCNGNRTQGVRDDEVFITRKNGTRLRAVIGVCAHCGKSFPYALQNGKGKFCSRSCHYASRRK